MYYSLGDKVFDGQYGPVSVSRTDVARYAEQPLVNGKPLLQRTGDELRTYALEFALLYGYIDPATEVAGFTELKDEGRTLLFLNGRGEALGTYVITDVGTSETILSPTGDLLGATVTLSLREYVDPDPATTEQTRRVQGATGVAENGIVPVAVDTLPPTPTGTVMLSIGQANGSAVAGADLVERAIVSPTERESYFARAEATYRQGKAATDTALAAAEEVTTLAAQAPALLADLAAVSENFDQVLGAISAGDLAGSRAAATALTGSTGAALTSGIALNLNLIRRV